MSAIFGDLHEATLQNNDYRRVIATTPTMQVVLMCLGPSQVIDWEVHHKGTQFIRVEHGALRVDLRDPNASQPVEHDHMVLIPEGRPHRITADAIEGAKLYVIYAPPEHAPDRVDRVQPDAEGENL